MIDKNQRFPTELTPQQLTVASTLAAGKTITATAEEVGINRSTIHGWLKNSSFVAHLNGLKRDLLSSNSQRLMSLSARSLDLLEEVLNDPKGDLSIRVKVALRLADGMGTFDRKVGTSDPELLERQWRESQAFQALISTV